MSYSEQAGGVVLPQIEVFEKWARNLVSDRPFNLVRCGNPSCKDQFPHYQFDYENAAWAQI